ncbi:cytoskeletal protein binding protein [Cryptotrichosporon argae]
MAYVGVVKALYDYDAQDPEEELSFKEDQILYVIEKGDDEWWKAKLKEEAGGTDSPIGLIPFSYVEEVPPLHTIRSLYAYESTAPDELSMGEDAVLEVFSVEDEWLLVRAEGDDKLGFVPRNYCDGLDEAAEVQVEDAAETAAAVEAQRAADEEEARQRELAAKKRELRLKDTVETWSVSRMDGSKKNKGTLGVGNGAIFFSSNTDKSPVKQYPIEELSVVEPSSKRLSLTVSSLSDPLFFHCGNADTTSAIVRKLESSKAAAGEALELINAAHTESDDDEAAAAGPKSVRWAEDAPAAAPAAARAVAPASGASAAVVLYDFTAQGDDELSVSEGERLTIVDQENDEWWLVRNAQGQEGVVPAQYVERANGSGAAAEDHEEEERRAAEAAAALESSRRQEVSRKEEERRAIEAAAREKARQEAEDRELAEQIQAQERERRERRERRRQEEERRQREQEAAKRREQARQLEPPKVAKRPSAQDVAQVARNLPSGQGRSAPQRPPDTNRPKPNPSRTRMWSDRTGQFKVEAEFLGMNGNKIRLHKLNGVIIEVPMEKMSNDDAQRVRRYVARKQAEPIPDDDDVPLGRQTVPLALPSQESRARRISRDEPIPPAAMEQPKPRKPRFDWFAFFLEAGCDMDDCTRYASNFERDRIDEAILPDLESSTMRSLGLREGDVIRVKKAIANKYAKKTPEQEAQIRQDEEYARQLQEHENSGSKGPAPTPPPGLFTSADGKLTNNTRRGRPERKGTGADTVDASALASASEKLAQVSISPTPTPPVTVSPPPEPKPAPLVAGFDDDAWTLKPSVKPASPAPRATPSPAPAPPPAPAAPPAPAQPQPSTTDSLLAQIQSLRPASTGASGLSGTNTGGSFDQLSQIPGQVRAPSAPVQPTMTGASTFPNPSQYGLGTANTQTPMGQLMSQPTGARGPLAPVPSNEGLLNPLQPSVTGMFVPTRPQQQQYQMSPQGTGMPQQPMMMQPTGYAQGFQQGYGQQPMQPSYTGFQQQPQQQSAFNAIASMPPPQQPRQQDKFAPSNIFSAMKRTDFGKPEEQQPQAANKYDALRPLTTGYNGAPGMVPQPTGYGMVPQPTGYGGMPPQQTGMFAQPTGMGMGMGMGMGTGMGGMQQPQQAMGGMGMMPNMTGYNPNMGAGYGQQNPYGYR